MITSSTSIPSANLCCSRFCLSSSNYLTWCPPHNITWLLRICNVFSNSISLLWNYAAQHNSTWLQTCWNIKRQLLWICVPGFICICENYAGPSIWVFTFSDKGLRTTSWESCLLNSAKPTMRIVNILLCSTLVFSCLNYISAQFWFLGSVLLLHWFYFPWGLCLNNPLQWDLLRVFVQLSWCQCSSFLLQSTLRDASSH